MVKEYPGKLSDAAREAFRAEQIAAIPGWYQPWLHLLFPSLVGLGTIAAALANVRDLRPVELLIVPLMLLLSNAVEWRIHKDVLHRRRPGAEVLYDRHTPIHHRLYVTEDMAMRSRREFRLVLLPAYGIVILLAVVLPLMAGLWLIGQRNVALLFVATCAFYTLSYEWLHLCYHLPADSFLGRRWLVRTLRRQHATHHAPELMQRWNFNVTIPLWDVLRGTLYKGARAEAVELRTDHESAA
jgi:sterol desaturase/sphingolipid hydroxylase (fatty acid hydroxylase superfamily)